MIHAHLTSWALALILFVIALFLHKGGKAKGFKVVKMILRVFYLLIIGTGFMLLFKNNMLKTDYSFQYIIKALSGLGVIGSFEMILAKVGKNKSTGMLWIALIIFFGLAFYLGFKLPQGSSFFA